MDRRHGRGAKRARPLFALAAIAASPALAAASAPSLRATIDASRAHDAVTRCEYGMFIEPIGDASAVTMDSHAPYVGARLTVPAISISIFEFPLG